MESWRDVWRRGFAPLYTDEMLGALRRALAEDDGRLIQGATSSPPPMMCVQDWPCEAACLVGYPYAATHGGFADDAKRVGTASVAAATVGEVEEWFARCCFEADQLLGEPAACRFLLNWYDDTPRDRMRAELLAEVDLALAGRRKLEAAAAAD